MSSLHIVVNCQDLIHLKVFPDMFIPKWHFCINLMGLPHLWKWQTTKITKCTCISEQIGRPVYGQFYLCHSVYHCVEWPETKFNKSIVFNKKLFNIKNVELEKPFSIVLTLFYYMYYNAFKQNT